MQQEQGHLHQLSSDVMVIFYAIMNIKKNLSKAILQHFPFLLILLDCMDDSLSWMLI